MKTFYILSLHCAINLLYKSVVSKRGAERNEADVFINLFCTKYKEDNKWSKITIILLICILLKKKHAFLKLRLYATPGNIGLSFSSTAFVSIM